MHNKKELRDLEMKYSYKYAVLGVQYIVISTYHIRPNNSTIRPFE